MSKSIMFMGIFVAVAAVVFGAGFVSAVDLGIEERHGAYWSNPGQHTMSCGVEFGSMDTNGDGILSRGEYEAAYNPASPGTVPSSTGMNASFAFSSRDRNNDYLLSPTEFCG